MWMRQLLSKPPQKFPASPLNRLCIKITTISKSNSPMKMLKIKVKPNVKTQEIYQEPDGSWTVKLKSPPVDGNANAELIQLLAQPFNVSKSAIRIKVGAGGRSKLVEIDDE